MKLIFTYHAKENMAERKININLVLNTILRPDHISASRKNRIIAERSLKNKILKVIYLHTKKAYIIITVYYIKSRKKNENKIQ